MQEIVTYNIKQAAKICRAHHSTLRQDIKSHKLKASRIGREYIIRQPDLDRYIDANSIENLDKGKCRSRKEVKSTMSTSRLQASQELESLLGQKTGS